MPKNVTHLAAKRRRRKDVHQPSPNSATRANGAAHSVLRAVETRRPILRCGNGGWSGWIDEFGNVRSVVTNDEGSIFFRGSRVLSVTRDSRLVGKNSFYVEHGDWFVFVCAIVLALGAGLLMQAPATPKPAE